MDKCGICNKPATELFETGSGMVYACVKCQPLIPEITIEDNVEIQTSTAEEESDEVGLYCSICHKSFQKSAQLHNHMRNHRAERRFVCTYCNKAFSQSNNLRAHLRIHTNERPYKCSECGKAFTQVTNLNNHVRLHTGERPFVCSEPGCNKAYAQVTNLNQHRKRHLNGRPVETTYDCTVCGEQFQQRNHMYIHRREAHSELKPSARASLRHTCKTCNCSFPSERLLLQHASEHSPQHAAQFDHQPDEHQQQNEEEEQSSYACVFSLCAMRFSSPREHTEHLLRAHQLRVLSTRRDEEPPKRGRPPKTLKIDVDPLDVPDNTVYDEVRAQIAKEVPRLLPKLKLQSLFQ